MVYADFCGPFPTGETVLVVIDGYSRYVEVEIMKSTTTTAVVSRLKKIFARHGYRDELTSDNEPPFNAADFDAFLNQNGVQFVIGKPRLTGRKLMPKRSVSCAR